MSLLGPKYYERHTLPKWNVNPSILSSGDARLTRRSFPDLSKADHERLAVDFAKKAGATLTAYHRAVRAAVKRYGDTHAVVSGAYADHFPEKVKERLRRMAHKSTDLMDASVAHWAAAGKRTPWRHSPLRVMANGGHE